jgi:cytochrome c2
MFSSARFPSQPDRQPSVLAKMSRMANLVCACLLSAGLLMQIFFAGLGALASSSYWPVHRAYGYTLMWLAFAMPLFGLVGQTQRRTHVLNVLGALLIIVQFSLIWLPLALGLPGEVRALHAVNAVLLFSVTAMNAVSMWRAWRAQPGDAPVQPARAAASAPAGEPASAATVLLVTISIAVVLIACLCASIGMLSMSAVALNAEAVSSGPSSAPAQRTTHNASAGAVEGGQATFAQQCSMCHSTGTDTKYGPGLAGMFEPGGPTLPSGVNYSGKLPNGAEINDVNVAAWIRNGGRGQIGQMPPRNLNDEEMAGVIAYLKTLRK